ncbi:MAG TPA: ribosomal protein L7/L12 [Coleofasciculaceae cyanobacterium]
MLNTTIEQESCNMSFFNTTDSSMMDWRIKRLEHKIDLILQHLGIEYEEDALQARLKYLISVNQKIAAIKELREQTGMGLREAKNTIEAMELELRDLGS